MKKTYKILTLFIVFITMNSLYAQQNFWHSIKETSKVKIAFELPNEYLIYSLDENSLVNELNACPNWLNISAKKSNIVIYIPNEKGVVEKFSISEAPVMEKSLQDQYPNIKSFVGQGIDSPSSVLRMSYSPLEGFTGMVRRVGTKTMFFAKANDNNYAFYVRKSKTNLLNCLTTDNLDEMYSNKNTARDANSGVLSFFRLALSCNGEYGTWAGGSIAAVLGKFNTTMTRVNGVYEQELAIHLDIVDDTNIIYLNATTDPYSGYNNTEIHNNITSVVGSNNFDIGHMFGQGGSGGNAGCIGCVCNDADKAGGYTSKDNPEGDTFDIDYVAHEMGHQFGGNHTFTSAYDGTYSVPANENTGANLEPGSGSTIMAYAGITGSTSDGVSSDVQQNSDDYFHFFSIQQITNYITTTSCQTTSTLNQTTPTADAGMNYTIPKNTPFVLTGNGTSDGVTSYCWEQNDLGGFSNETTFPTATSTSGPSFRSFDPTISQKRYFPKFSTVVDGTVYNGATGTKWELLNTVARTYNFKLTVRDNIANGAQNKIDAMQVVVDDSVGPFSVSSQTTLETWSTGDAKTITWNVAGSDSLASNVKIAIVDMDGTELAVLVASTTNDGSESVTVPSLVDDSVRIMVSAVDNIFYAINSGMLAINSVASCDNICESSGSTAYPDGTTLVQFNTINNPSTGDSDYTDYTAISTSVNRGQSYNLTVNVNTDGGYTEVTKVWIDWNRDCSFNTTDEEYTLGEAVNVSDGATSLSPLNITVPAGASLGSTTMRVSSAYTNSDTYPTSCGALPQGYGEVEDYTIVITDNNVATNSIDIFSNFVLSPNPNNGNFNIRLQSENTQVKIAVFDLIGRQVFSKQYENNQLEFNQNINLNTVQAGMYIVHVSDGNKSTTEKIIIK